jgi:hypothetical protein
MYVVDQRRHHCAVMGGAGRRHACERRVEHAGYEGVFLYAHDAGMLTRACHAVGKQFFMQLFAAKEAHEHNLDIAKQLRRSFLRQTWQPIHLQTGSARICMSRRAFDSDMCCLKATSGDNNSRVEGVVFIGATD